MEQGLPKTHEININSAWKKRSDHLRFNIVNCTQQNEMEKRSKMSESNNPYTQYRLKTSGMSKSDHFTCIMGTSLFFFFA